MVLTSLGVISTLVFTVLWVLDGGLIYGLLALVSALILAAGIILLKPLQHVDKEEGRRPTQ